MWNKCLVLTIIKMRGMVMKYYLYPLPGKSWWEHWYLYLAWTREEFTYDLQRIREVKASIFTPPALSSGVWEEPPQSSIRDLPQCWMRRKTAIQQMIGWIYFHLSFAYISTWVLREPVDFQSEYPSMNGATFYKHSRCILYSDILHPIILIYLVVNFWITIIFYKCFGNHHPK